MSDYPIPDGALSKATAIIGTIGSGKTYTAKSAVERLLDEGRRVCVLDPTGVWWGLRSRADGKAAGYPVVVFGGEHADVPIDDTAGAILAELVASGQVPASIIDLSEFTMGARRRFGEAFARELHRLNRAPLHLIIDEADEFAPQNPMPETRRLAHEIDRIVRRGRVKGFRPMLITQRPAVLDKNVLNMCNTLVAMRLPAPQDRKAVEGWIKGQADEVEGKKVMASLARLQQGEGWVWCPVDGVLNRAQFPLIKTFDSSKAPEDGDLVAESVTLAPVDLAGIRERLAVVAVEEKSAKGKAAPAIDVNALQQEAWQDGYRSGKSDARAEIFAAIEQFRPDAAAMAVARELAPQEVSGPSSPAIVVQTFPQHAPQPKLPRPKAEGSGPEAAALRLLQVLIDRHPARWTWAQAAALATLKPRGGHFNGIRKHLRVHGLVAEESDYVVPSAAALKQFGHTAAAPATPLQILEMWQQRLPSPAPEMLAHLRTTYPGQITRGQLADAIGKVGHGGHWNGGMKNIRQNGLIEESNGGAGLRLLPALFDGIQRRRP